MRQLLQSLRTGKTEIAEVPIPRTRPGYIQVRSITSLISAGTERMLVEFGRSNYLSKAAQQPDKVRQVIDKIKTDGVIPTVNAVFNKLDQPIPMGYSNVGTVLDVGPGVTEFTVGDLVVSNGGHAEVVSVPKNLCAKVPSGVDPEEAAFTVVAAVGLQGIRLAEPTLGEAFVVTGMGLIGLITAQLLRAHGCRVLGIDFDSQKLALAQRFGVETVDLSAGEDPIERARTFSRGRGVDGVIITAATKSSEPVHQAAVMCRKRGRIVLVGVTGLELSRADFYEKELSFQVSCSYGPGRYDPTYEEGGQDYPIGFVRWTEQRNFEAVLDMLASGRLDVKPLITHRFPFEQAAEAYALITSNEPSLGVLLQYPTAAERPESVLRQTHVQLSVRPRAKSSQPVVGFIGAGNFASQILVPAFQKTSADLHTIASTGGVSGFHLGRKAGFRETTTDTDSLFTNPDINTIVITTRHDSHAHLVCKALEAGKHVFVEKPLAINREQLEQVVRVHEMTRSMKNPPILSIGFNRRFAPHVLKMKALLSAVSEPKTLIMTVNAGYIPPEHWTQDPTVGGGRIIGEGCHFIDLLRFLVGHPITGVQATMMGRAPGVSNPEDKVSFTLQFADGSFGTVHYLANGHKSYPKERLEVFCASRVLQLDNFRRMTGYGWPGFRKMTLWTQDKGHVAGVAAFTRAIQEGQESPIPFEQIVEVTRVSFDVVDAIRSQ